VILPKTGGRLSFILLPEALAAVSKNQKMITTQMMEQAEKIAGLKFTEADRCQIVDQLCIFCLTCTTVCPEGILDDTFRMDIGGEEHIQRRCGFIPRQLHKDRSLPRDL